MDLSARIVAWREHKGLSRQALAAAVGVSVAAVYQWEGGKSGEYRTAPSVENLEKLVGALGLTMGEFYGRPPRKKSA